MTTEGQQSLPETPRSRLARRRLNRKASRDSTNLNDRGKMKLIYSKQGCMLIFAVGFVMAGAIMYYPMGMDGLRKLLKFL